MVILPLRQDHVIGVGLALGLAREAAHRTGGVHRVGVTTDKRVPRSQRATLGQATVSASGRQPVHLANRLGANRRAGGHALEAMGVVAAATTLQVEQGTGNVGVPDLPRIRVFEFVQAALGTPVAKRLPFIGLQGVERVTLPEAWTSHGAGRDTMARVFAEELGMRAVFLDVASVGEDITTAPLAAAVDSLALYDATAPDEVIVRSQGADVVITNKCRFDADTLAALPELRYIGLTATGADGVDLVAAGARGIAVTNITAYCTQSVAQHVFAVLLALTHRIVDYDARVQAGGWQRPGNFCLLDFPIRELSGRVMGIVGYGELGRAVARLAEAFGMTVHVAQRDADDDRAGRVPIEALFEMADVVSLHCPLNASTHHLVDAAMLARMKPDAVLINTARGGLVDAEALAAALRDGRIGGAAIDVLEQEPPVDGNALIGAGLHNLIVTPHMAWAAREARQRAIDQTAENLRVFLNDGRRNRIDIDPED